MMKKEAALNEAQVELLKYKLQKSVATAKAFMFFSKDVTNSFLVFILIVATAFLAT